MAQSASMSSGPAVQSLSTGEPSRARPIPSQGVLADFGHDHDESTPSRGGYGTGLRSPKPPVDHLGVTALVVHEHHVDHIAALDEAILRRVRSSRSSSSIVT